MNQNSIIERIDKLESLVLKESKTPLKESFKSKSIAQFIKLAKSQEGTKGLPWKLREVEWSEIPEDEVIFVTPDKIMPYLKPEFAVIWGLNSAQTYYDPGSSYDRYGTRRDNKRRIGPGAVAITSARKFLCTTDKNGKLTTSDSSYDIPGEGYISVKKLMTELADYCLVIDLSLLEQYRTNYKDKKSSRRTSKEGATAFMNNAKIASQNKERYQRALKDIKINAETKEVRNDAKVILTALELKINRTAGTPLLSTKQAYNYANVFELNKSVLDELSNLISHYNRVSEGIVDYLDYFKRWGLSDRDTARTLDRLNKVMDDARKYI